MVAVGSRTVFERRVYVLGGQKGGVGKTTISWALGLELQRRGLSVLLVDADPQGSLRTAAAEAREQGTEIPTVVAMGEGLHRDDQLPRLAAGFDRVVVDCPPAHGTILRGALMVADVAILPVSPSPVDVWALAGTVDLVANAQQFRPQMRAVVLVNRRDPRTALSRSMRETLEGQPMAVLGSELGMRVAYAEALMEGRAPTGQASQEVRSLVSELEEL